MTVPRLKIKDSRQAGVTLLLAILILSSVLAISFSLATIMFIEVRSSGDLLKTEPALYAATGVGEQAFFNLERHACPSGSSSCYISNFSNNVTLNGTPTVLATSTPIVTVVVKAGSSFNTSLNRYDFCAVTAGSGPCNYGLVTVNYITTNGSNDNLYAYLCEFNPNAIAPYPTTPCTQPDKTQGYWNVPEGSNIGSLLADGSVNLTRYNSSESWLLNPNLQQQLILTNPSGGADIYVKISTYADQLGSVGKGLPYTGKTAVSINTINAAIGRKIQVEVPNNQ
jgi:hypothetical protein